MAAPPRLGFPGEPLQRGDFPQPLAAGPRRVSAPALPGWDVVHQPSLRAEDRAGPDREVIRHPGLSGHDHPITNRRAPRYADLRGQEAVPSDRDVVRDLDE